MSGEPDPETRGPVEDWTPTSSAQDVRDDVPPAMVAARRRRLETVSDDAGRPYARASTGDIDAVESQLAATRALLTASSPQDVVAVVAALVRDFGGAVVPARLAESAATIHVDVSFGLSEPMLPWADPVSVASMRLARDLPGFIADARVVFDRLQAEARRAEEAERDPLTGLLTRRVWMRRLGASSPEDAVCLIDLDHFKAVNDRFGHVAGDQVLRAVADLLMTVFRTDDACGRYGGDELVCLAAGLSATDMAERTDRLRAAWHRERSGAGAVVGLSVGVAQIGDRPPRAALEAADRAMYRAKAQGRGVTAVATPQDYVTAAKP